MKEEEPYDQDKDVEAPSTESVPDPVLEYAPPTDVSSDDPAFQVAPPTDLSAEESAADGERVEEGVEEGGTKPDEG